MGFAEELKAVAKEYHDYQPYVAFLLVGLLVFAVSIYSVQARRIVYST